MSPHSALLLALLAWSAAVPSASAQAPAEALVGTWEVRADTARPSFGSTSAPFRLAFGPSDRVAVTFAMRDTYTIDGDQITVNEDPATFEVQGDTLTIENERSSGRAERFVMARASAGDGFVGTWRVVRYSRGSASVGLSSEYENALFRLGADGTIAVEITEDAHFRLDGGWLVVKSARGTERRRRLALDGDTLTVKDMTNSGETVVFERTP